MPWRPPAHRPCGPAGAIEADRDRNRRAYRKLLWTRRWRRFRAWLISERPLCEKCQVKPSIDGHHVRKLELHPEDLCDPDQVKALCHECHAEETAAGK